MVNNLSHLMLHLPQVAFIQLHYHELTVTCAAFDRIRNGMRANRNAAFSPPKAQGASELLEVAPGSDV